MENPTAPPPPETEAFKVRLNAHLRTIDAAVTLTGLPPKEQVGITIMATVMAMRRLFQAHEANQGMIMRGLRLKMIKAAVDDFNIKLRRHVHVGAEGTPVIEE